MPSNRHRGFTLVELIVVVAIITLLLGLLLPALGSARHAARTAVCLSQHRQLNLAFWSYAADSSGHFPQFNRGVSSHVTLKEKKYSPTADENHVWWAYLIRFGGLPSAALIFCPETDYDRNVTYDGNPRSLSGTKPWVSVAADVWPNGAYHGGVWKGSIGMRSFGKSITNWSYNGWTGSYGPFPAKPHQVIANLGQTQMLVDTTRRSFIPWWTPDAVIGAQFDPYNDAGAGYSIGQHCVVTDAPSVNIAIRHGYRTNVTFFDGHAKTVTAREGWYP